MISKPYKKTYLIIGFILGLLNSILWIVLGRDFLSDLGINYSIQVIFCLILNFSISISISLKDEKFKINRIFWIIGIMIFISIICAFTLGSLSSYDATEWGAVSFFTGAFMGGIFGLVVGFIIGSVTTPSNSYYFFQQLINAVITSTIIGIFISVVGVIGFAYSEWIIESNPSDINDLFFYAISYTLILAPAGIVPSVVNGFSTSLTLYFIKWLVGRNNSSQPAKS